MNIKLIRIFDKYVLSIICIGLGIFTKLGFKRKIKNDKILIIKLWALGDSVVLLPSIKAIREKYSNAKIDVLCHKRNKDVFSGNKYVDEVIEFNIFSIFKMFRKYDICIDTEPYLNASAIIAFWTAKFRIGFSHGIRSFSYNKRILFNKKQHMVKNYIDMINMLEIKVDINLNKLVKLNYSQNDKKKIDELLRKNNIIRTDYIIGICPGVAESVKSRMWPKENFAELSSKIIKNINAKIIFIDSFSNKEIVDEIVGKIDYPVVNLAGKTSIKELFYLIEKCDIFISNDTGSMHIAAAQGVKTIGLFGPNTPKLWGPYGEQNISIYYAQYCSPCIDNTKGLMPKCFNKTYQKCMKDINVNEVYDAVKKLKKEDIKK